jgi:hypothetical protein
MPNDARKDGRLRSAFISARVTVVLVLSVVAFLVASLRAALLVPSTMSASANFTATSHDAEAPLVSEEPGELCRLPSDRARTANRSNVAAGSAVGPTAAAHLLIPRSSFAIDPPPCVVVKMARSLTRAELMVFLI